MKRNLVLLLIFFFFFSGRMESQIPVIDLLAPGKTEITNLSEIAADIQYVPLQTTENSLIRYVYGVIPFNDKLYVNNFDKLLCFDKTGHFLYKLDKKGNGPEEYNYISDYDISPANNLLIVQSTKKMLEYKITREGFTYSKTVNFKDSPMDIEFCPDQKSVLLSFGSSMGNEPFRYVIINLNGDTLKKISNHYQYEKNSKMMFAAKYENLIFHSDGHLQFKFWLSDTIYTIDKNNNISPYLRLDSHGKHITTEALADFGDETMSGYLNITSIMETQRYLIYRYYHEKSSYFRIWDKVNNKTSFITMGKTLKDTKWLTDDIAGGVDIEPKFCIDGILYSWIDAINLKKYFASDAFKNSVPKNPDKKKALQNMVESIEATDNPVLIVVTPKK